MLFGDNILDFDDPKESTLKSRTDFVKKHKKTLEKNILFYQIQCTVVGKQHFIMGIMTKAQKTLIN